MSGIYLKQLLLASSLLVGFSAHAASRDIVCSRYGLSPGSEEFIRCVNNSQNSIANTTPKKAPKSSITPPDKEIEKTAPIPVDVGRLTVAYQPDADAYYPSFSKRNGEQGAVVIRLIVDQSGSVEDAFLLQSSTFPRLDRAGYDIGKRYIFKPYLINGKPIRVSTNLLIKFNLKTD
jgi:TonB family protein